MEEGFYGPALWSHPADTPAPKAGVNTSTTGDRQINHSQPGCVMGKSLWCLLRTHPERQSCCQSVLHPHVPRALGSFSSLEPPHHSPAKLIFSIHLSSMYTQRREGICCVLAALFEMILKIKVVLVQPVLGVSPQPVSPWKSFVWDFLPDCVEQSLPAFQTDGCIIGCCLWIFFGIICFH